MPNILSQDEIDGILMEIDGSDTIKMLKFLKKIHGRFKKPVQKAFIKNLVAKVVELERAKLRENDLHSQVGALQLAVEYLAIRASEKEYQFDRKFTTDRQDKWGDFLI